MQYAERPMLLAFSIQHLAFCFSWVTSFGNTTHRPLRRTLVLMNTNQLFPHGSQKTCSELVFTASEQVFTSSEPLKTSSGLICNLC